MQTEDSSCTVEFREATLGAHPQAVAWGGECIITVSSDQESH